MKTYQLYGLGNALVDVFVPVGDDRFAALGFERGSMRLVEPAEQKALLDALRDAEPRLVSGGSVANSTIAFSQLGGRAAFLGCVGDDRYGLFYKSEFDQLGVELNARGNVARDGDYRTNVDRVFVCGDMGRGQSLIVWAIAEGRSCASAVDKALEGSTLLPTPIAPTAAPLV